MFFLNCVSLKQSCKPDSNSATSAEDHEDAYKFNMVESRCSTKCQNLKGQVKERAGLEGQNKKIASKYASVDSEVDRKKIDCKFYGP